MAVSISWNTTFQNRVCLLAGIEQEELDNATMDILANIAAEWFAENTGAAFVSMSNLVNNSGVVGSDVTGVGTARRALAGAGYGGDKAIFAFGYISAAVGMSNLVSNSGVVASDVSAVGTARNRPGAAGFSLSA